MKQMQKKRPVLGKSIRISFSLAVWQLTCQLVEMCIDFEWGVKLKTATVAYHFDLRQSVAVACIA